MSGHHRVTAASVSGDSRASRRPHPGARLVTTEYRRARLSVVLALLLLAGTAVYLVVQQRQQTWGSARESVLNLALGLETSVTGLLEQSAVSLRVIGTETSRRPGAPLDPAQVITALRDAARFDSVSSYLGVRSADGHILAVARAGQPALSPAVQQTIAQGLEPSGTGLGLSYLLRLSPKGDWYLPITLDFRPSPNERDVAFALVPVRRLLASTDTLRLIPDSLVDRKSVG